MKKILFVLIVTLLLPNFVWADDCRCLVLNGIYNPPDTAQIDDAKERDPSVIGAEFYLIRETGSIVGNGIFSNTDENIKVLRNTYDIYNNYEVLSMNKHSDVKLLKISKLNDKAVFRYYFGWLGLLLTGECYGF